MLKFVTINGSKRIEREIVILEYPVNIKDNEVNRNSVSLQRIQE